jgi:hypothetical protein
MMNKSDLMTGHVATLRNGISYVVYVGVATDYTGLSHDGVLVNARHPEKTWFKLEHYTEDLKNPDSSDWDIVKIQRVVHPYDLQNFMENEISDMTLVWERVEPRELTLAAIEEILGYPVKIVEEIL